MTEITEESASLSSRQLAAFATLLQLMKRCRHAADTAQFGYLVVNETFPLIEYRQAVLWRSTVGGKPVIEAVSGVDLPDRNSPYAQYLRRLLRHLDGEEDGGAIRTVDPDRLPEGLRHEWPEWFAAHGLWCPLFGPDREPLGGLWLTRPSRWQPPEIALLEQLADAYGHAWAALRHRPRRRRRSGRLGRSLAATLVVGLAVASLWLPVRLSVLAPATVVPADPVLVAAPMAGVVANLHVAPNQPVKRGEPLFSLDDTELRNRYEVARKALAVVEADYQRARQQSLYERESNIDIELLKARVEEKQAEARYAAEQLERITVVADRDGIALFDNVNDWLGRPVITGEKVLTLADPGRVELEVEVPVDNAITLAQGAPIRFFLNTAPSRPLAATLRRASYEPQATAGGGQAYRVRAGLTAAAAPLRIGLKGTAKIYGRQARLWYFLLRRPLAFLRRSVGM